MVHLLRVRHWRGALAKRAHHVLVDLEDRAVKLRYHVATFERAQITALVAARAGRELLSDKLKGELATFDLGLERIGHGQAIRLCGLRILLNAQQDVRGSGSAIVLGVPGEDEQRTGGVWRC